MTDRLPAEKIEELRSRATTVASWVAEGRSRDPSMVIDAPDLLALLSAYEREPARLDEVERLTGINSKLVHDFNALLILESRTADRAEAAESRVTELEKGLEPLGNIAREADQYDGAKPDFLKLKPSDAYRARDLLWPVEAPSERAAALLKGGQSDGLAALEAMASGADKEGRS